MGDWGNLNEEASYKWVSRVSGNQEEILELKTQQEREVIAPAGPGGYGEGRLTPAQGRKSRRRGSHDSGCGLGRETHSADSDPRRGIWGVSIRIHLFPSPVSRLYFPGIRTSQTPTARGTGDRPGRERAWLVWWKWPVQFFLSLRPFAYLSVIQVKINVFSAQSSTSCHFTKEWYQYLKRKY